MSTALRHLSRVLLLCSLLALCACAGKRPESPAAPPLAARLAGSGQLVLVLAKDLSATTGELRAYDRVDGAWKLADGPLSGPLFVNLGRKGLAWGAGLHGENPAGAPVKREGDGKAPVGLFAIGEGFAYDPAEVGAAKVPLLKADADLLCVDDVKSAHYNAIVRASQVAKDWDSVEDMRRKDEAYRYGALVRHNMDPAMPGGGSCIFLHVWLGRGVGSSGCTNMAPEHMLALLRWLDAGRKPVMALLPEGEYQRLKVAWGLPEISQ